MIRLALNFNKCLTIKERVIKVSKIKPRKHGDLSYKIGKNIDNLVELFTENENADYKKILIYYQTPNKEQTLQTKDDLLQLELENDIVFGLDGRIKAPKDTLNELPDDIVVKKTAEEITLNQGKINEIVKLRSA